MSSAACCVHLIDVGTQETDGQDFQRLVYLGWEVVGGEAEGSGRRPLVYKSYVLSLSGSSQLKVDVERLLGHELTPERIRRFDLKSVLGKCCYLNTAVDSVGGTAQTSTPTICPLPSCVLRPSLPTPLTPHGIFMTSDPDMDLYEMLPSEIQQKIRSSPEFLAAMSANDAED